MAMTVEAILEEAKRLPPEEQARLRAALTSEPDSSSPSEEELDCVLSEKGLLAAKPKRISQVEFDGFQPVSVEGEPLSTTLLGERR